ncbi:hypothetical protein ACEWY4_004139 [Coilia grayii]|uniref:Uncharacterized protein n=1 Tax=Coilia grayii TaxID=363190 RepID=A0ABD1KKN4_9TELE
MVLANASVVFHYRAGTSRYTLTFEKAKEACQNVGATIATEDQLTAAFEDGFDQYPIATPRTGCYGDKLNKPGIRTYGIRDASELYDVYCYVGKIQGEVFYPPGTDMTLKEAQNSCKRLDSVLASPGQLHAAWREGLNRCDYSWLSDGSVRYPITVPSYQCSQGTLGVRTLYCYENQTGFPLPTQKFGASCFPALVDPCHNLHCTEDEVCGEVRGIYGCLCKDNHHRPNPESFALDGFHCPAASSLRLGFLLKSCTSTIQTAEAHFKRDEWSSTLTTTTKNVELNLSITHLKLPPGKGTYQIQMIPYEDADFTQLFSGAVAETSDEKIYISVDVDGVDSRQFSSVLDLCWATPTNNSASSITWSLITKQCANPEDGTVEVFQNGVSTSSRFSFRMFTFEGHSPQLYLHCSLHLCLLDGNSCALVAKVDCRDRDLLYTD